MRELIPFTRFRLICPMLSLSLLLLLGAVTFIRGGFNFSIDFSPGLTVQIVTNNDATSEGDIRDSLAKEFSTGLQIQQVGEEGRFTLRVPIVGEAENFSTNALENLSKHSSKFSVEGSQFVGPDVARKLTSTTIILLPFALLLILLYVWLRFKLFYAVSAIIALIHDTLFMLAVIGSLGLEFSSATVAALLTIIGYSLNDTIVIFDRIRENRGLMAGKSIAHIINRSLTQTLSRTMVTSLTTVMVLIPVVMLSYGSIRTVAIQLIVGVIVGTYSSIFIASMVAYYLQNRQRNRLVHPQQQRNEKLSQDGDAPKLKIIHALPPPSPLQQSAEEIELARIKKIKKRLKHKKKK